MYMDLRIDLQQLSDALEHFDKSAPEVSKSGVDWHLDHTARAFNGICRALIQSNPDDYKAPGFNLGRVYVLTRGKIPRGKGKAPKVSVATEEISKDDVIKRLGYAKEALDQLDALHPNVHFSHPYFGVLNKKRSIKFIRIHTQHHLDIIRDIVKAQG